MSWRTPRRGLTYSLSPAEAEEPSTLAELYVLKVPVDSGPPASADGQQLGPAAGTANRIIALLRGWFASSLPVSRRPVHCRLAASWPIARAAPDPPEASGRAGQRAGNRTRRILDPAAFAEPLAVRP
jgi:hypothetical protein